MNKTVFKVIISLCFTIIAAFIICPLAIQAALNQSAEITSYIKVERIDSLWCDKNQNVITKLDLPEYVSPGEKVQLNDAIYTKNTGVPAYARFKIQTLENNTDSNCFKYSINSNWIKGNDNYYYYCNIADMCIIPSNQLILVIEDMRISDTFLNKDKNTELKLILTLEVIDANSNEYISGWENNPPSEWFKNANLE